jgi:hypothetical protein
VTGKRRLSVLGTSLALLACTSGAADVRADRPPRPSMGTNLDAVSYSTSAQPFLDLFKGTGGWAVPAAWGGSSYALDVDSDGWVRSLPATKQKGEGLQTSLLASNPAAPAHTRYVVLYEGEGTISTWHDTKILSSAPGRLIVQSGAAGDIRLTLTDTDPNKTGNYVRDIHVVQEKYLPLFEAGLSFNPEWLGRIQDLNTLRFMDWMSSNSIYDQNGKKVTVDAVNAAQIDWEARPKVDDARWLHGIPVELMVELSNRTGTDMWVNMPVNASDDYIRGFATYVKEHLRPDLKVHVEFSNEIWNWGFIQTSYAQARAKEMLGAGSGAVEWAGMRAAQTGQIWNDVFGEPATGGEPGRAIIVFATQAAWHGLERTGLETPNWKDANGKHVRAADYFDEYAIGGYYYGTIGQASEAAKLLEWSQDPEGVSKALSAIRAEINGWVKANYTYHGSIAQKYGLNLVTYEAGPHIATPASMRENKELTNWLIELNRRPEFYEFEQSNYENFRNAGGSLFLNYGIISTPSKWGSWGALERTDQAHSPRYDALLNYNNNNDPWWGETRHSDTFANSKYHVAGNSGETITGSARGYDVLLGGAGNDTFVLLSPQGVVVDGKGGSDTIRLSGAAADYKFEQATDGSVRIIGRGKGGLVKRTEAIRFGAGSAVPLRDLAAHR